MIKCLTAILIESSCITACIGSSTIELNNKDANAPIYLNRIGYYASGNEVIYVSIYEGVIVSVSHTIYKAGTAGNNVEDYVFTVDGNGYFDAGVGVITDTKVDGATITMTIVAWLGDKSGPTQIPTSVRGSLSWEQNTRIWDPQSGTEPTGPALKLPSSIIVGEVPETNTLTLGLLGGAALLTTNKVAKTIKRKTKSFASATSQ